MSGRLRDRVARRAATGLLERIGGGRLTVEEGGTSRSFGPDGSPLHAHVEIRDPRAWARILLGSNGLADAYVERWWDSDDPVAVVRLAARNMAPLDRLRRRWHPVLGTAERLARLVPRNTRRGARAHIAAHYDLGNRLFSAFLDERLMYSSAWFPRAGMSLDEAQLAKLNRICEQLELGPDDHVLEIGTGWGGLAAHAAAEYGCRVTTTTISAEQHAFATQRVAELGLGDRVAVLDCDYRDLKGRFDKLVSIEMIEAVGWQYFDTFFRVCSERLQPQGLMFLQAIVIDDALYEYEKSARSFANTQVFPGGCLPSQALIDDLVAARTDMRPAWSDDITDHYVATLSLWRERFNRAAPALAARGYDERFRRRWNFYLSFSEAGFRERRIRDLQLLFAKPRARTGVGPGLEAGEPALA
jgi:cyclopropane-fatty-acyl-phospholipid synthase